MDNSSSGNKVVNGRDLRRLKYFLWFVGTATLLIGLAATWRHTSDVSSVAGEIGGGRSTELRSMVWQDWTIFVVLIIVVETVFLISYRLAKRQNGVIEAQNDELRQHSKQLETTVAMRSLKLRETEQELRAVLASAPVVVWMTDSRGHFTLSEGSGLKLLGLEPGAVIGRKVSQVYKDFPKIIEHNRRALAGETFTARVEVGNASFVSHYSPIRDGSGNITGVLGVALALAADDSTAKELKRSEDRYGQLVRFFPLGMVIFRVSDGTVVFANPAALKLLGIKNEKEIVGRRAVDFVHPDYQEIATERMNMLKLGMPAALIKEKYVRADGTAFDVEVTSLVFDYDGAPSFLAVFRDVTAAKEAEERMRREHEVLQSVIMSVPSPIIGIDRVANVTIWNPAAERLFGWQQEEAVGKKIPIIPEDREEEFRRTMTKVLEGRQMEPFTAPCLKKNGDQVKCTCWPAAIRDVNRAVVGAYVMFEKWS